MLYVSTAVNAGVIVIVLPACHRVDRIDELRVLYVVYYCMYTSYMYLEKLLECLVFTLRPCVSVVARIRSARGSGFLPDLPWVGSRGSSSLCRSHKISAQGAPCLMLFLTRPFYTTNTCRKTSVTLRVVSSIIGRGGGRKL